jgi:hypothetical protein
MNFSSSIGACCRILANILDATGLYFAISLANSSLLDGDSLPSGISEQLKASTSVCPMTVKDASMHD